MKQHTNSRILLSLTFVLMTLSGHAQGPDQDPIPNSRRQQLEAMKVGFITQKLALTPTEAQKFWPVYNNMSAAIENNRKQEREIQRQIRTNFNTMGDKEMAQLADKLVLLRQNEGDIFAHYHKQFVSVLPIRKVLMLYRAEEEWKVKLLEEIRSQHNAGGARPGTRP